jgi:hypothetical protein
VDELIQELIELVKAATPMLWAAAHQRVMAGIAMNLLGALMSGIALGLSIYGFVWAKHRLEDDSFSDAGMTTMIPSIIVGIIAAIVLILTLITAVGFLVAPDYYAIYMLIRLVK